MTASPQRIEVRIPDPLNPLAGKVVALALKASGQDVWRLKSTLGESTVYGDDMAARYELHGVAQALVESGEIAVVKQRQVIAGLNAPTVGDCWPATDA